MQNEKNFSLLYVCTCWAVFALSGCVMSFFLRAKPLESNEFLLSLIINRKIRWEKERQWIGFLLSRTLEFNIISSTTDRFWPTFPVIFLLISPFSSQILLLHTQFFFFLYSVRPKKYTTSPFRFKVEVKLYTHYEVAREEKERKPEISSSLTEAVCYIYEHHQQVIPKKQSRIKKEEEDDKILVLTSWNEKRIKNLSEWAREREWKI